jgi:hypothetical protein
MHNSLLTIILSKLTDVFSPKKKKNNQTGLPKKIQNLDKSSTTKRSKNLNWSFRIEKRNQKKKENRVPLLHIYLITVKLQSPVVFCFCCVAMQ